MFPQQVEALIKGTAAAPPVAPTQNPAPAPLVANQPPSTAADTAVVVSRKNMVLTIDGRRHDVCVEKLQF
jgi:hypothetical protein